MDQTEQTIHPAVLTAAEPAFGSGWLLLARTPKGPSEERVLGTRAVLISLVGATTAQLQKAANETLDLFDRDASASPAERARRALTATQKRLGESVAVGLVALSRNEVLVARTSGVAIAARRTTEGRMSTIMLPDDAPGASSRTLERGGISATRLSMSPKDRVALAITSEDAKRAVKAHTPVSGVLAPLAYPAVLLEVLLPVRKAVQWAAPDSDTLINVPTDPVAVAKINARTRWEEGNLEREARIAAAKPAAPKADQNRPDAQTRPYEPIDTAAQAVIDARRPSTRSGAEARARGKAQPPPARDQRTSDAVRAAQETARAEARLRAEHRSAAEPRVERLWRERAATSTSFWQRAAARIANEIERRAPWLTVTPAEPTLRAATGSNEQAEHEVQRTRRRRSAAILLAAVLVAGVGGATALVLNGSTPELDAAAKAREALRSAEIGIGEALDPQTNLLVNDPARAKSLLLTAVANLNLAETGGGPLARITTLRTEVTETLNKIFLVNNTAPIELFDFEAAGATVEIQAIVQGPDGLPYVIDKVTGAVYRIDAERGRATVVYQPGFDLYGTRTGRALLITASGPDLVVFDASSNLWRWRPSDGAGKGTLVKLRVRDGELWGSDVKAIVGFAADPGTGLYRLYVVDPSARQILRYQPAPDGTGYPAAPTGYLINPMSLGTMTGIAIDGDVYMTSGGALRRYSGGAPDEWTPAEIGDELLRPLLTPTVVMSAGASRTGIIYVWDSSARRVIAYSKASSGAMLAQYVISDQADQIGEILGGYILPASDGGAPTFVWAEAGRVRSAVLGKPITQEPGASVGPTPDPVIETPIPTP
ncbi:MAG: hypothetical protein HQ458_04230 [Chloroflexi bacterium]|nr:hypothetical protein [Chloroflexota bacterium]